MTDVMIAAQSDDYLSYLCRDAYGMTQDELLKETLALFGWKRRTEALVAPIKSALASALADGVLTMQSNGLVVSTD